MQGPFHREPGRGARGYDALWNRKDILFIKTSESVIFHLSYCSSVRHFCEARDADKLEAINKRIRFVIGDYSSPTCLCNKRVQNFLSYLVQEFIFHSFSCLYEKYVFNYILSPRKPKTTTYSP